MRAEKLGPPGIPVVVMGVSGSGKSTVGAALARRLGVPFADADAFANLNTPADFAAARARLG